MSVQGKIVDVDAKHGYGFIEEANDHQRVFFHLGDMCGVNSFPHINDAVQFDIESDAHGCQLALNIYLS